MQFGDWSSDVCSSDLFDAQKEIRAALFRTVELPESAPIYAGGSRWPDFPYVVTSPGIHHELLKVVRLATLADPNSARVICFLRLILWRIARAFECFPTSVRFEGVLATRFIIRIAFGIVRFTFGNFVVFHIIGLVRVKVAFRLSLPRPSHESRRACRVFKFDRSSSGSNPSPIADQIALCRRPQMGTGFFLALERQFI